VGKNTFFFTRTFAFCRVQLHKEVLLFDFPGIPTNKVSLKTGSLLTLCSGQEFFRKFPLQRVKVKFLDRGCVWGFFAKKRSHPSAGRSAPITEEQGPKILGKYLCSKYPSPVDNWIGSQRSATGRVDKKVQDPVS